MDAPHESINQVGLRLTQRTRTLRVALALNCCFSITTGLVLLVAPHSVADWIGSEYVVLLRLLGLGLLGFAGLILWLLLGVRRPQAIALAVSFADFGWVLGTAVLMAVSPAVLSGQGWLVAWSVAGVVLLCGVGQIIGIDRSFRHPDPSRGGWYLLTMRFPTNASASSMWRIVRAADSIHQFSAQLRESSMVAGDNDADGLVRECWDTRGKRWREALTIDDEHRRLEAVLLADRPDFPFSFRRMEGGWTVEPVPDGCVVWLWWDLVPKRRWTAFMIMPLLASTLRPSLRRVIDNMRDAAADGGPVDAVSERSASTADTHA